jgi:CrcB protein
MNYVWVFIGGGLGSVARYELTQKILKYTTGNFPWATILVNFSSCFILGLLFSLFIVKGTTGQTFRLLLGIGFCGGFSTFSAFTFETFELLKTGNYFYAGSNMIISIAICLFSLWMGWSVAKFL